MFLLLIQLFIVLLALYVGARYGSIALGAISGIGLALLVFGFGLAPGTPPTEVIYIIIAAVTCAGVLQASGGMDFLIQKAEILLRKKPNHITFYAPLCTFFLTILVGTGHVVYTLMPIICDISLKKGIRPERPCAVASIASQIGITCSPIAAAVVAFASISTVKTGMTITIPQILIVTIPACLFGIIMASIYSYRRGKDLYEDPKFLAKLEDPEQKRLMFGEDVTTLDHKIPFKSKVAFYIFMTAVLTIILLASFENLLPIIDGKPLGMSLVIQIVMVCAAGIILIVCEADPKKVVDGAVWKAGMVAVVAIYGIAWLSDTFFLNYKELLMINLEEIIKAYPWAICFVLFGVSVLINTQGGVVLSIVPLAYDLGIPFWVLLGVIPSIYGYFFIPNYPSDIATVNFDRSGTTSIGKYLLNHSFMIPGLICVITSTIVSYIISMLLYSNM